MAQISGITVGIDGDLSGLNQAIAEMGQRLGGLEKHVEKLGKTAGGLDDVFKGITGAFTGLFALDKLTELGGEVLDVTTEFQKLQAVLTNTLGSQEAGAIAFAKISDFAAQTNFSVLELTDSFTKLANRNVNATTQQLQAMADVANSLGKPLESLTEAILDVSNTERWNELGIKVSKAGDRITASFKGQTVSAKATEQGALDLVTAIGKFDGVAGSTAAVSKTLGGSISNLGDTIDSLFFTIGNNLSGPGQGLINFFSEALKGANKLLTSNQELAKQAALKELGRDAEAFTKEIEEQAKVYQKAGDSAEEARKKAEQFLAQDAQNQVARYSAQIEDLNGKLQKVNALYDESTLKAVGLPNSTGDDLQVQIEKANGELLRFQRRIDMINKTGDFAVKVPVEVDSNAKKLQEEIAKIYSDVFDKLEVANSKESLFGDQFQLGAERVKILESGINSLLEKGLKPTSAEVKNLIALLEQAENMSLIVSSLKPNNTLNPNPGGANPSGIFTGAPLTPEIDIDPLIGYEQQLKLTREQAELLEQAAQNTGIGISQLGAGFIASGKSLNEYLDDLGRLSQLASMLSDPFAGIIVSLQDLQMQFEQSGLSMDEFVEKTLVLEEAKQQFDQLFKSLATSAAQGLGDVAANLASGSDDAITVVRKFLAGIASQLAVGLIAIGTPMLFTPTTAGAGALYIAAGVALKAIAGALGGAGGGSLGAGGGKPTVSTGFSNEDAGVATKQDRTNVQVASATNVQGSTISRLFISGEFELVGGLQTLLLRLRETEGKLDKVGG
ncbi:hypothetical protein [Xanthocytophaga agilis]|uniref:Uncharacterized protein n=1 Tax=Xanthocytophaga agilis TaxID=3048010 RepID=A0AAE3R6Y7_9BACT|nr:hypothetical protein [Xanthocytophaga agilis]MDJ1501832.1 hypothetical protein [Xanthocytophaga agilis]